MNAHDFRALLRKDGWQWLRTKGSHEMWRKGQRVERWTPGGLGPGHNEISGGLLKELVRRFNLEAVMSGAESPQPRGHRFIQGEKKAEPGTFGRRLLEARTAAGMSQMSLAKLIAEETKVKPQTIQISLSSWERGDSSPFKHGTTELKIKTNRNGETPASAVIIGTIAELFGFNDLTQYRVIKSATQQLSVVESEPEHFETVVTEVQKIPESRPMSVVEALEEEHERPIEIVVPAELPKPSSDQKAFVKLIKTSDVMQFLIDQDNEIRKLHKEINDLKRGGEATAELRDKARKYDEIQRLLGK